MFARAMRAVRLVLDVLAQERRVRLHRLEWIDQRRQLFIVDLNQLHRIGRDIAVGGDDKDDLLVLEQHFLMRQNGLHIARQRRHVMRD